MSSELKPCPFCKEQERLFVQRSIGDAYWGKCLECGAEGPIAKTEQEAINAWNQRAERTCKMMKVHGDDGYTFVCSECNRPISYFAKDKYCPQCGAKVVE